MNKNSGKIQGNILYKIYYEQGLVYLGRTKQPLQDRIRGHVFKKPMHRSININLVTKIEYTEFKTEADMFLYEIYYINTLKPPLNIDDRARDNITVTLPEVQFIEFSTLLWEKWKDEINNKTSQNQKDLEKYYKFSEQMRILKNNFKSGILNKEDFELQGKILAQEHELLKNKLFK